ncbi:MAG TPA: glutathione S-transferase N-terminal domain-containing protein [Sphingomicrobium sp.]
MKLFTIPGTCALSVHVVLEWLGVPYAIEVMSRGSNRTENYLAINPSGQVPAFLLDDGRVLTEAAAILVYLSDLHPEAGLGNGNDPFARYELGQLLSYLTGEVHVAFKPYFQPARFLADESLFKALQDQAFAVLDPMLRRLDGMLAGARFILNDRRSVADPYLYVLLRWVDNAPRGISPYPELARYRRDLENDGAVLRALKAQA